MVPWEHVNYGCDEHWAAVYPFEQDAGAGSAVRLDAVFTNHAATEARALASAALPPGWAPEGAAECGTSIPPRSVGRASLMIRIPPDAAPGLYVIPLRLTWNGRYLGQARHGMVYVY